MLKTPAEKFVRLKILSIPHPQQQYGAWTTLIIALLLMDVISLSYTFSGSSP